MLCGGHGYSLYSGLPQLYAQAVPAATYEGDNVVLYLQVQQREVEHGDGSDAGAWGRGRGGAREGGRVGGLQGMRVQELTNVCGTKAPTPCGPHGESALKGKPVANVVARCGSGFHGTERAASAMVASRCGEPSAAPLQHG